MRTWPLVGAGNTLTCYFLGSKSLLLCVSLALCPSLAYNMCFLQDVEATSEEPCPPVVSMLSLQILNAHTLPCVPGPFPPHA